MYYMIVFLPLLGFLIATIGGKIIAPRASELVTSSFMVIVAGLSWISFLSMAFNNASTVDI
ncbi:MAG: hypothetical protein PV353_02105, partial [Bartonella sp.]|nr:hypothetical protein [Bartonella sp.]